MAFDLPPRPRIRACFCSESFYVYSPWSEWCLCVGHGPALSRIIALKYNPGSLQLTASNLKESSVGKIVCQGRIESSRRGTHLFFQGSYIKMRTNWAIQLLKSQRTHGAFDRRAGSVSIFVKDMFIWHICKACKGRADGFITCPPWFKEQLYSLPHECHVCGFDN